MKGRKPSGFGATSCFSRACVTSVADNGDHGHQCSFQSRQTLEIPSEAQHSSHCLKCLIPVLRLGILAQDSLTKGGIFVPSCLITRKG